VRLLLTALHCPKGDVAGNLARHLALLALGKESRCDLVLFPEMSLTGYRAAAAVDLDDAAVAELVIATAAGPAACFGIVESAGPGAARYITQVVAAEGRITWAHRKATLGEGEDDDFQPGAGSEAMPVAGVACSMAVCAEIGTPSPYRLDATVVLGPSAPGLYGARRREDAAWRRGYDWWRESTLEHARQLPTGRWLAVSTQAGATDDEDFPGWAALVGPGGRVVAELPDWREGNLVVELP
jgi:predicted amidohydrolase